MLYRLLFDTIITRTDPERAHSESVHAIGAAGRSPLAPLLRATIGWRGGAQQTTAFTRPVPGFVGLAAGMDKNATAVEGMDALGFAFVEVGTVTPEPQPGNEQPRMWRHVESRALRNAMGFNNDGSRVVARRLKSLRSSKRGRSIVVGVNIGKNKWTSEEEAAHDYAVCASRLARYADYLAINVSSPNTPGLRDLQNSQSLRPIINATKTAAYDAADRHVPILLKIAPDMNVETVREMAGLVVDEDLDGIIATNTTVQHEHRRGGLSGEPLTNRSLDIVRELRNSLPSDRLIIGVGGITTVDDAQAMLGAGADLLQVYSSFVYEGPCLPGRLNRALSHL
ncbi:quinone-dependent dihydroorotate dehydrogenase [Flaviflexus huanghaiensis]|uniref:quinone-dependent dihydroorotate dehydrogenase n=1 Tax=Flaviflexus huanghaiensis TaxID=1111473 RepID=UPI0015F942A9